MALHSPFPPVFAARSAALVTRSPWSMLLVALLGFYLVFEATIFYPTAAERAAYFLAFAPMIALGIALAPQVRLRPSQGALLATRLALVLLPVSALLLQRHPDPAWILGDLATVALPLTFYFLGLRFPGLYRDRRTLALLGLCMVGAMLLAPLAGRNTSGRFQPPTVLLQALAWMLLFVPRRGRLGPLVLLAAILSLTLLSGFRSYMGIWCLVGALAAIAVYGLMPTLRVLVVALFAGLLAVLFLPQDLRTDVTQFTRLHEVAQGRVDSSLLERFEEVSDCVGEMRRSWTPLQFVIGAGHGATYRAVEVERAQNMNEHGRVHQIHVTPFLLYYRYGILGLGAFLLLGVLWLQRFLVLCATPGAGFRADPFFATLVIGLGAYWAISLTRNVLVDPLFSFTVAGVLCRRRPRPAASDAAPPRA